MQDYLDRVCAPLIGRVPYARRMELRRELAHHLTALAEAYEELGANPEDALAQALEQFGPPDQVGREWLSAWRQGSPSRTAPHAVSLTCFILSSWLGCLLQIEAATQAGFTPSEALLAGPLLPVLAGLTLCLAHRSNPWITRAGLAFVPLVGAAVASDIPVRPNVSLPFVMSLTAISWGILGAATTGIAIHVEAWQNQRHAARATR